MEGRDSKKIEKITNFQKCPKTSPKVSKYVLNVFGDDFFENFFCAVHPGGSKLRKNSKKSKIIQIFKNVQKRPQKCPNMF